MFELPKRKCHDGEVLSEMRYGTVQGLYTVWCGVIGDKAKTQYVLQQTVKN